MKEEEKLITELLNTKKQNLKYHEKLYLNRKGYSSTFKSITREKRYQVMPGFMTASVDKPKGSVLLNKSHGPVKPIEIKTQNQSK